MKRKTWIILCGLALVISIGAAAYAVNYVRNQRQGRDIYTELAEGARATDGAADTDAITGTGGATDTGAITGTGGATDIDATTGTGEETETGRTMDVDGAAAGETIDTGQIPIDFRVLQAQNEEIYAWITVPGTAIDYPVVQSSTDDSFYIHRGIDREELYAGAIYSEMQNARDFSDPHTVLYGHNMKDGSMFATLHRFQDREFFDRNREMIVYTPEQVLRYEIFAAYTFDDRHILNSFDFNNQTDYQKYLDEIYGIRAMDAFFREKPVVTTEDQILTLSTCIGNPAYRYLVQGVLKEME